MMKIVPVEQIPKPQDIVYVPVSTKAEIFDAYKRCLELEELSEAAGGIGISAVQAGIPWKLFLVKSDGTNDFAPRDKYGYFVNCEYEATDESKRIVSLEGCLSLRSLDGRLRHFQVERHSDIKISGYRIDVIKNIFFLKKIDWIIGPRQQSVVFQHEIDHCSGILISDKGREVFMWRDF